ncbi:hypothetical protein DT73_13035 [Mangrovibacter sp. MFB070]|uniref:hypothetical protein n=1 Tax=Mangrovibacter sp. MFB070 TaxID=1224318 RepID=UPI0004D776AC|nr:hypothetical protein [Mangrovibacter sp. MFB070]KEA51853.1 hypothetical protein DT73_13035 [Mangrovibacter sp. MFB070]
MNGWQGTTPQQAGQMLVKDGTTYINNMQKEITNRARALSKQLQEKLNTSIEGGPVAFTKRTIFFNFIQNSNGTRTNQIIVRSSQLKYLQSIIFEQSSETKFVPTDNARLNKQGNIVGLKAGLNSKRYVVVEQKGKKYLIDTTKKQKKGKQSKRIVAVRETKKRKMIFDFFENAEKGARLILNNVNGQFKFTKG